MPHSRINPVSGLTFVILGYTCLRSPRRTLSESVHLPRRKAQSLKTHPHQARLQFPDVGVVVVVFAVPALEWLAGQQARA